MSFNIKEYKIETKEDIEKLEKIENSIFNKSSYSYDSLVEMIKTDNYRIYALEVNSKLIAYMIVLNTIDFVEILKIGVIKEFRNKGLGQKLIEKIKMYNIFLEVRESNVIAINFYLKNGFKKISIRKNYYTDTNENAIIMKLEGKNE